MSTTQTEITTLDSTSLKEAEAGSFYTILGAGGDLQEWVDGLTKLLVEAEIGTPVKWYRTTGKDLNAFAEPDGYPLVENDRFPEDLTVLMFSLEGLDVGRLAIFKIQMQDRWFDDIVDNMRARAWGDQ